MEAPLKDHQAIKDLLLKYGYLCMSQNETRMDFNNGYTPDGFAKRVFHLHLREFGDHEELYFRDYMNEHPNLPKLMNGSSCPFGNRLSMTGTDTQSGKPNLWGSIHTPGHLSEHMCFLKKERGYLLPATWSTKTRYSPTIRLLIRKPILLLWKMEKIAALPVKRVFLSHHTLDFQPEILVRMRDAFRHIQAERKLHNGSGTFDYGDWTVWL